MSEQRTGVGPNERTLSGWRAVGYFLGFLVFGMHGWSLAFKLPFTLAAVFRALRPGGMGVSDGEFWAFGQMDARFRSWYTKIARDYHTQGRFGYVWDDGLGMPLGVRIYNNLVTYRLLHWLGTRHMASIGCVLQVSAVMMLCGLRFGLWVGLGMGLLLAGSPLVVGAYTHLGKPEVFWWWVAPWFVFMAFTGQELAAGLLWSALAWSNLSVSVMLVLLLGPALLVLMAHSPDLGWMLLGVLPGVLKHMFRALHMLRSGFLASLTSEQARLWKRSWHPTAEELVWWLPFVLSIGVSTWTVQRWWAGIVVLLACLSLYWANFRMLYINDVQAFHLGLLGVAIGYAAYAQSLVGLGMVLLLAYNRPTSCGIPATRRPPGKERTWYHRLRNVQQQYVRYPALEPLPLPRPKTLMAFFEQIPSGARIIAESDGDPRAESRFRAFWQWSEEILPWRQIDLVNEMYTRMVEPGLVDSYLNRFRADQMAADHMHKLCEALGVSYVIAHTEGTIAALRSVGYEVLAHVDLTPLDDFRWMLQPLPATALTLLRNPSPASVIHPSVRWQREGNVLSWEAEAGKLYTVRYRYSPRFHAVQERQVLEIRCVRPLDAAPLTFMTVRARVSGRLSLKYDSPWL